MKCRLVEITGGALCVALFDAVNARGKIAERGYLYVGVVVNPELRPELQGLPQCSKVSAGRCLSAIT